jgi:hypothetical protein
MKSKVPTPEYLEKAKQLNNEEIERLLVRMRGRFARRLEDKRMSAIEAIALQLEYEDEELEEWRERLTEMRKNEETGRVSSSAANSNINLS